MRYYKYKSKKTTVNGKVFDSRKEAHRYEELLLLQKQGEIGQLRCQVPFELLPKQTDESGKILYRSCKYIADFTYYDKNGNYIVEDVKGMQTDVYKLKKKMMYYFYKIEIKET